MKRMGPTGTTPNERERRRAARRTAVRRRRLIALALLVTVPLLVGLAIGRSADGSEPAAAGGDTVAQTNPECATITVPRPAWRTAQRATMIVDSVLLGGVPAVKSNLGGWKVTQLGRPAVMIRIIEDEIAAAGTRVAPLVILGVGYNSLWERDRRNFRNWAREFDRHATALLRTLRRLGAKQFVWVTLRDARRSVIPSNSRWQYDKYSWYFPYVNERLRRIDKRAQDVVLADWAAVSDKRGLTYDAIHLDPDGQALMARTIRKAIESEAVRQMAVARAAAEKRCKD